MASSSKKRIKHIANRGQKRKEQIYSNKFLSHMHERHFQTVPNRRLLMERKVGLIPTMAPEFGRELERRQWENLASYHSPANIAVVKEFYTNARTFGGATHEMYTSYVRGKRIPFDADTINSFLGGEWAGEKCKFALAMDEDINYADVERTLCMAANEINQCAHTVNNKSPLGHPSLVTQLCELVGVNISTPPLERPKKEIDASYYTQYYRLDEAGIPMPAPHPPKSHTRAPQQDHGEVGASRATATEEDAEEEEEEEEEDEEEEKDDDDDDDDESDDNRG
ncbi:hypothetical protein LR48_Vigan2400s000100 [Vigna angularis]|nr:hypothetical protein LR48_Vigan2400s000100 [Vigna angularis]